MSFYTSNNLSPKAARVIAQLGESGDSQSLAVAECLNTIAENGDEQATDEYLIGCAEEIIKSAARFIAALEPAPTVRHTVCRYCDQDIEGLAPYPRGQWRDRGNNTSCLRIGGVKHLPVKEGGQR